MWWRMLKWKCCEFSKIKYCAVEGCSLKTVRRLNVRSHVFSVLNLATANRWLRSPFPKGTALSHQVNHGRWNNLSKWRCIFFDILLKLFILQNECVKKNFSRQVPRYRLNSSARSLKLLKIFFLWRKTCGPWCRRGEGKCNNSQNPSLSFSVWW